ncbi:MAG: hypothetical protein LBT71_04130 [Azoarcus sp.]|jgi:hypothetical protein|nr:hypothetical protein [Azoarcus sp.]
MAGEPHPLTIRLKPSPVLLTSVLAAHFAVALALFLMDLPLAVTVLLWTLVAASAVLALRAHARKRGVVLVLTSDGVLRIGHEGGEACARVLPGAVLFPVALWFTLVWTDSDGRVRRLCLMLTAAEVERENSEDGGHGQWRRLRTWLRHCALQTITATTDA